MDHTLLSFFSDSRRLEGFNRLSSVALQIQDFLRAFAEVERDTSRKQTNTENIEKLVPTARYTPKKERP
jgi:hypothetical protein